MAKSQEELAKERADKLKARQENFIAEAEKLEASKNRLNRYLSPKAEPENWFFGKEYVEKAEVNSENLSNDVIRAIVLGAAIDEEQIQYCQEGANGVEPVDYLVMNALISMDGTRNNAYEIALYKGRQRAQEALDNLEKGDDRLAKQYAKNFMNYSQNLGLQHPVDSYSNEATTFKNVYELYENVKEEDLFRGFNLNSEADKKIQEKNIVGAKLDDIRETRRELLFEIDRMAQEERESKILDVMTAYTLGKLTRTINRAETESIRDELISNYTGEGPSKKELVKNLKEKYGSSYKPARYSNEMDGQVYVVMEKTVDNYGYITSTYQTEMLTSGNKSGEYIDRVRENVKQSSEYINLINKLREKEKVTPEDALDVADELDKVLKDTYELSFAEKDEKGNVIENKVTRGIEVNKLFLSEEDENKYRTDSEKIKNNLYDLVRTNGNIVAKVEDEIDKSIISEKIKSVREHQTLIYDAVLKNAKARNISLDLNNKYDSAGKATVFNKNDPASDLASDFVDNKDGAVILKNEAGDKCYSFTAQECSDGSYKVEVQELDHLKLRSDGIYPNLNTYRFNDSLLKARLKNKSPLDCDLSAGIDSYIKVMEDSYRGFDESAEHRELLDSMKSLRNVLSKHFDIEERVIDGKKRVVLPEMTPVLYNEIINAYNDCNQKIQNSKNVNPYDATVDGLSQALNSDLELFNELKAGERKLPLVGAIALKNINSIEERALAQFAALLVNVSPNHLVRDEKAQSIEVVRENNFKLSKAQREYNSELALADPAGKLDTELKQFILTGKTDADRTWNNEMVRLASSNAPQYKKRLWEKVLDKAAELDFSEYRIDNSALATENTGKLTHFINVSSALNVALKRAKEAGLDIYADKYENIRNNAKPMELLGKAWDAKLKVMTNPAFEAINMDAFSKTGTESVDKALEFVNDPARKVDENIKQALNSIRNYVAANEQSGYKLFEKTKNIAANFAEANKNMPKDRITDPTDHTVLELRYSLDNNKRLDGKGKVIENSPLYANVINSINAYRDAKLADKDDRRKDIIAACNAYTSKRNAKYERTKLVASVREQMEGLAKSTEHFKYRDTAVKMLEAQRKSLAAAENTELKEFIFNPINSEKIIGLLVNAKECQDSLGLVIEAPGFINGCKAAFTKVENAFKNDNAKKNQIIDRDVMNYIEAQKVDNLDYDTLFTATGKAVKKENLSDTLRREKEIFVKNKEGGLLQIDLDRVNSKEAVVRIQKVKAIPYPNGEVNEEVAATNAKLANMESRSKNDYNCQAYEKLESLISIIKSTGEKNPSKEIGDVVKTAEKLNTLLVKNYEKESKAELGVTHMRYPDMNREQFTEIRQAYNDCLEAANRYSSSKGKNALVDEIATAVKSDLEIMKKMAFDKGSMPLAVAVRNQNKDALSKQENAINISRNAPKKNSGRTQFLFDYHRDVIFDYLAKSNFVQKYPDGVVRIEDYPDGKYYFSNEGKILSHSELGDLIKSNIDSLKEHLKTNNVKASEQRGTALNKEIIKEVLSNLTGYQLPDEEQQKEYSANAQKYDDALTNANMNQMIERFIGYGGQKLDRSVQVMMKAGGTEEDRKWNRELAGLFSKNDDESKRKAYEMILDDLTKYDPKDFDIRVNDLPLKKPEALLRYSQVFSEAVNNIKMAKQYGVDIYQSKYDKLRKDFSVNETLPQEWISKWRMKTGAIAEVMDESFVDKINYKEVDGLNTQFSNNDFDFYDINYKNENDKLFTKYGGNEKMNSATSEMLEGFLGNDLLTYDSMKKDSNYVYSANKDVDIKDVIKEAKFQTNTIPEIEVSDKMLVDFRKKLEGNKRKGIFGGEKKNSDLYTKVINAIDNYRQAPLLDKVEKHKELLTACRNYVANRNKSERSDMILELGKKVKAMKSEAAELRQHGLRQEARKMVDDYREFAEDMKAFDPTGFYGKVVEKLGNLKFTKDLAEDLTKTEQFDKYFKSKGDMPVSDIGVAIEKVFKTRLNIDIDKMAKDLEAAKKSELENVNNILNGPNNN